MRYTYEITERPASFGGGWRLRLQEDGQEVGGGVFPAPAASAAVVAAWWASLDDEQRVAWLDLSGGTTPADAHLAFTRKQAYQEAEAAALAWLSMHAAP